MQVIIRLSMLTMVLFCTLSLIAQNDFATSFETRLNNFLLNNIQEKVYVQTNSNRYAPGDTLWFKSTLVNAITHTPPKSEKLIYIDLVSPDKKVLIHQVFYVFSGFSAGCLPLKKDFEFGTYTLIAYTNYMRNFSSEFFFQKEIELVKSASTELEWEFNPSVVSFDKGDSVIINMLAKPSKAGEVNADAEITVQLAKGNILGGKAKLIGNAGSFRFFVPDSLRLPQATFTLSLPFEKSKTERFKVELSPSRPDLQFMPEGGWLIPGYSNIVAFKCIDASGTPILVSGSVFDPNKGKVADFETEYQGMGTFRLDAADSINYQAEISWQGKTFRYALPKVNTRAYGLHLVAETVDSIEFHAIKPTDKMESIGLMCHTRGQITYFAFGNTDEKVSRIMVPKDLLKSGLSIFTLLAKKYPMAERLLLIEKDDHLNIAVSVDKKSFGKREKVDVGLKVTDNQGNPVVGSFSMNAFDLEAGLLIDPNENILNYLLYSSDLRGKTFEARHFFDKKNPLYQRNLDLLMLTSGWRRFAWPDVLLNLPRENQFPVEKGLSLSGEVRRAFNNKPVPKNFEVTVSLKQKHHVFIESTRTDDSGRFFFDLPEFTDSAQLVIQTKNRLGWQRDYLIDLQSNLEKRNLNHIAFNKTNKVPLKSMVEVRTQFLSESKEKPIQRGKAEKSRKDNYYFPGRDTFLIEEVEVRSDFLTRRDSLIHQTGEPDVVIESTQLEKLSEQIPWYSTIWDLLQDQIPGLLIMQRPYDAELAKRFNLVIGNMDDAVYFRVHANTQGRLLISVDGEFLGNRSVKLYDFLSYMDPAEIESVNFIAQPKKYENATFDKDLDVYSSGLSYSDASTPIGITTEINDLPIDGEMSMDELFIGEGSGEIGINLEYLEQMERVMAPPSYLYISTKSKKGIFASRTKGIAHLYLQGLSNYREFYSPKYETQIQKESNQPDNRTTLYWDPNVVTDQDGEASVSFYTGDSGSPFGMMVQGLSLDGQCGVGYFELNSGALRADSVQKFLTDNYSQEPESIDYSSLQLVAGLVTDRENGAVLSSAHIFQEEPYYHVACNFEGEFFIELQRADLNKAFTVLCPGYLPETITPEMIQSGKIAVELRSAPVFQIVAETKARNIVRESMRKSNKLYANEAVFQGYFREAISVNSNCYGIFESAFHYTNKGVAGDAGSLLYETERFKNMEDRNGHPLLILKPNHRNRFYPLNSDVLSIPPAFWQYNYLSDFEFLLLGEVMLGNTRCYKIIFDQVDNIFHPLEKGILYIEKESLALRRAQWEVSPKARTFLSYTRYLQSNPMGYGLQVSSTYSEANYSWHNEHLILQSTKERMEILVNNVDVLKFERSLVVNSLSTKSRKLMSNSTFDSLVENGKAKRMQVKEAQYQIGSWVRYGIIKPERYLINDARFMHDITQYR